jgi:hypothetical protein
MSTESDKPASGRYGEAWWSYVAAELEIARLERQRTWGDIDELLIVRFETGRCSEEEKARVERAMRDFPAVRESIEIGRELRAEWETLQVGRVKTLIAPPIPAADPQPNGSTELPIPARPDPQPRSASSPLEKPLAVIGNAASAVLGLPQTPWQQVSSLLDEITQDFVARLGEDDNLAERLHAQYKRYAFWSMVEDLMTFLKIDKKMSGEEIAAYFAISHRRSYKLGPDDVRNEMNGSSYYDAKARAMWDFAYVEPPLEAVHWEALRKTIGHVNIQVFKTSIDRKAHPLDRAWLGTMQYLFDKGYADLNLSTMQMRSVRLPIAKAFFGKVRELGHARHCSDSFIAAVLGTWLKPYALLRLVVPTLSEHRNYYQAVPYQTVPRAREAS